MAEPLVLSTPTARLDIHAAGFPPPRFWDSGISTGLASKRKFSVRHGAKAAEDAVNNAPWASLF
jgi:hypothetical protein